MTSGVKKREAEERSSAEAAAQEADHSGPTVFVELHRQVCRLAHAKCQLRRCLLCDLLLSYTTLGLADGIMLSELMILHNKVACQITMC